MVHSWKKAENLKVDWHRAGEDVSYFANGIRRSSKTCKSLFTLRFSYTFEFTGDVVYFAYCYPYTYSRALELLDRLETDATISEYLTRRVLCCTIAGNRCDYLTITSSKSKQEKRGVCFTARVHPGETVGSWMMEGTLDWSVGLLKFLSDPKNPQAALLRDNFVFKIVPMLNPDGVINGNYRCSLAGCDLNRRWKSPSKVLRQSR